MTKPFEVAIKKNLIWTVLSDNDDVRIVFLDQTLVHTCISGTNNLILFLEIYNRLQVEDFTQFLVSWAENAFFLPSEVCQLVVLLSSSVRFFKLKVYLYF